MKKLFIFGLAVAMLSACGNDPVTNAGYFDDDLDRSVDNSYHDDHSQHNSTTYNIDQSQHNDNSTTITTVVDSVVVIRDTFLVDTYDTVHVTIQDTVLDTIKHSIKVPIYDTISILTADTLLLPVIDTIHRPVYVKDTVKDTIVKKVSITTPIVSTEKTESIQHFDSLDDIELSINFYTKSSSNNSLWDNRIAINDKNKTRTRHGERMYTITYYGYDNNRYVIHYRTSGSLWQYIRTNNGCINIVDVHISAYTTSDCGEYEFLWATGSAVICV
jgi:hypothetical protein